MNKKQSEKNRRSYSVCRSMICRVHAFKAQKVGDCSFSMHDILSMDSIQPCKAMRSSNVLKGWEGQSNADLVIHQRPLQSEKQCARELRWPTGMRTNVRTMCCEMRKQCGAEMWNKCSASKFDSRKLQNKSVLSIVSLISVEYSHPRRTFKLYLTRSLFHRVWVACFKNTPGFYCLPLLQSSGGYSLGIPIF